MEEQKSKIQGWRKLGIGMGAITALSVNSDVDFKIAVIIGIIAVVGIAAQGVLDWRKNG